MPIYEYRCKNCGEIFEAIQKFSDDPLESCKFCGGPVERLISQTSFQLKGSGWYVTDYARKSEPKKPESTEKSTEKSTDKPGTPAASESKPERTDKVAKTDKPATPAKETK